MIGRPPIEQVPRHLRVVKWLERDPATPRGLIARYSHVELWACGVCGAEGRMWSGEPPRPTPELILEAKAYMGRAPARYPLAVPGAAGCPRCAARWLND